MNTMRNKLNTPEEIQRTLDSIDGLGRATANPFLFTRVQARLIHEPTSDRGGWQLVLKPMGLFCALAIIVGINAVVFLRNAPSPTATAPESEQLFANEFDFGDVTEAGFLTSNDSNHETGNTNQ